MLADFVHQPQHIAPSLLAGVHDGCLALALPQGHGLGCSGGDICKIPILDLDDQHAHARHDDDEVGPAAAGHRLVVDKAVIGQFFQRSKDALLAARATARWFLRDHLRHGCPNA
jgi:hypothetical protein